MPLDKVLHYFAKHNHFLFLCSGKFWFDYIFALLKNQLSTYLFLFIIFSAFSLETMAFHVLQGTFFDCQVLDIFLRSDFFIIFSEPTNNIAPKLVGDRYLGKVMSEKSSNDVYMLCQIIGYPSPIYRFVTKIFQ